jgi:two-component system response regulator PilR (NtrC family)
MNERLSVLLVMPRERRVFALEQLESCRAHVILAGSLAEARQILAASRVDVVITDTGLPDGDWQDIVEFANANRVAAQIVVSTRLLERCLCAEVFKRGAYDLLVEPYSHEELRRVLESAAAKTYMDSLRPNGAAFRAAS